MDQCVEKLLAAALRERRAHVEKELEGQTPLPCERGTGVKEHREEALRAIMVRLWPKLVKGTIVADEVERLLSSLWSIGEAARGEDLRFLDAWNNVYEAMARHGPPDGVDRTEFRLFRRRYLAILDSHLRRLGNAA